MTWLLILTILAISLACAFYGTTLLIWTVAVAAGIVLMAATGSVPIVSLVAISIVFAAVAVANPAEKRGTSNTSPKPIIRTAPAFETVSSVTPSA